MSTGIAHKSAKTVPRPRSESGLGRAMTIAIFAVGVVLLGAVAVLLFGACSGEEFLPSRFRRRNFFFYQIPLVEIQVTPVVRRDVSNELENYLMSKRYLSGAPTGQDVWHLVSFGRNGAPVYQGDADILTTYLDQYDEDYNRKWLKWSRDHPNLAKVFWPHIANMAHDEMYYLVPDAFALLTEYKQPDRLKTAMEKLILENYRDVAKTHLELGEAKRSTTLLRRALALDADSIELHELQAKALEGVDELSAAANEREIVKNLKSSQKPTELPPDEGGAPTANDPGPTAHHPRPGE